MSELAKAFCWIFAAAVVLLTDPQALAQQPDQERITEEDKKVFREFLAAIDQAGKARNQKLLQVVAVSNLRQIGIALFEFETEYGEFPNAETAVAVKEATETKADLKAATANDCFFQLIVAGIITSDRPFFLEAPAKGQEKKPQPLMGLEKCAFSYLSGMSAAGNPSRPVVVGPLVKGRTTFAPAVLGGKAVVLRVDNSVQTFPIGKDGRVLINGLDIFDADQPFWDGNVPPILWPED